MKRKLSRVLTLAVCTAMTALQLGSLTAHAAVEQDAFQTAINASGSNLVATPFSPYDDSSDSTKDAYSITGWTIEDGSVKHTSEYDDTSKYTNAMLHIEVPTSEDVRILSFQITGGGVGKQLYLYAGSYSADNGGIQVWLDEDGCSAENVKVNIGCEETDFYLVTKYNGKANFETTLTVSLLRCLEEESVDYDIKDTGVTATFDSGVLTIGGTGTNLKDISAIPEIIRNDIKEVVIGENITALDNYGGSVATFKDMPNLTKITFTNPENITTICKTFDNVGIKELYLDMPNLTNVSSAAFINCTSLERVYINANLASSNNYYDAFKGSGVAEGIEIEFAQGTEIIPEGLFWGVNAIKSVTIPDSVTTMGVDGNEHSETNTFRIFETTNQTSDVTVYTDNEVAKNYKWAYDIASSVTFESYMESDVEFGKDDTVTGDGSTPVTSVEGVGSDLSNKNGVAVNGTVQPITTLDISFPVSGISFMINSDREFVANTTTITNNSNFPIDVYMANISGSTGDEPNIVADNTYKVKEWDNLTKDETLANLALSINENNLSAIYDNTALEDTKFISLGNIASGFETAQDFDLVPSAYYGKRWGNTEDVVLVYNLTFEFRIP